ncbi:MAG: calcium/sodium antiporter [Huintestinicola sp.]
MKKVIVYAVILAVGILCDLVLTLPENVVLSIILLVAGFMLLVNGADYFVEAAASLAKKMKIPSLIVGLTICAMGTSAPELAVSISAASKGANEIAISNIIGSNSFNLLVVLGVCALIMPIAVQGDVLKRDFPVSLAAIVMFAVFILDGMLARWEAVVFIACLIGYMAWTIVSARRNKLEEEEDAGEFSPLKCILGLIGGVAGIIIGGNLVVDHATVIATAAGMSPTLVGLTICAMGTSLPELVTSITASKKGENDMAVGNVVGSNIFNVFCILGISGAITPISASKEAIVDSIILIVTSIITYIFCITGKKITRVQGGALVAIYAAYTAYILLRNYVPAFRIV